LVLSSEKKGGGVQAFKFNSMDEIKIGKFASHGPSWRRLRKGLNLNGRCNNKECDAYK
jgi:hypothetical protein